jgi:hypothetical protein
MIKNPEKDYIKHTISNDVSTGKMRILYGFEDKAIR